MIPHHESEADGRRLTCPQRLHARLGARYRQNSGSLADDATVHHRLVPGRYGGGVVEDDNVRLELAGSVGLVVRINRNHALSSSTSAISSFSVVTLASGVARH